MSTKRVLQINAAIGIASSVVSVAMAWLVLTRPVQVASAVADGNVIAVLRSIGGQLTTWLQALMRFL
jgi:hypothetical protein